jgi:hypothetical protein
MEKAGHYHALRIRKACLLTSRKSKSNESNLNAAVNYSLEHNANAQTQTFTREGVEYVLDLPSPSWRAVSRVDVHEHLEFVNGDDYSNGYLRLRKKVVTPDTTSEDLFREARSGNYRSCPVMWFVAEGREPSLTVNSKAQCFLTNSLTRAETWMAASTIFAGQPYLLHPPLHGSQRKAPEPSDQMDSIARSFRLK